MSASMQSCPRWNRQAVCMLTPFFCVTVLLVTSACGFQAGLTPVAPNSSLDSKYAVLTEIATSVQPTPLPFVMSQETGIIPGRTTEAQVKEILGEPRSISSLDGKRAWWYRQAASSPGVMWVVFANDLVHEVIINEAETLTAEQTVTAYGSPEALLVSSPPTTADPPGAIPIRWMLYPSRGFRIGYLCISSPEKLCDRMPRNSTILEKVYQVPMALADWLSQYPIKEGEVIKPFTGFSD